jgi:indole-3-acetate monooxygenase
MARGAIEDLTELATAKTPTMTRRALQERPLFQIELARAEATVRSARAWLFESVRTAWETVTEGRIVSTRDQALLRLAATNATARAVDAVDLVHSLAGGSAIRTGSRLERVFRDVHTAAQHFSVQPAMYEPIGRALLNLPPEEGLPL